MKGVWVALPNLDELGRDLAVLKHVFNHYFEQGVEGALVLGTTGQGADKTIAVRRSEVELLAQACPADRLVVGVSTNPVDDAREIIRFAAEIGVKGVAITTPFYNHYSDDELKQWLAAVLADCPQTLEYYIYNIPGAMHHRWSRELLDFATTLVPVAGIKDSSGDMTQLLGYLDFAATNPCDVLIGDERFGLYSLSLGGAGFVSGLASAHPGLMCRLYDACTQGKLEEAVAVQKEVNNLVGQLVANSPRDMVKVLVQWMRKNGVLPNESPATL